MWTRPSNDQFYDEVFLAGERVPPGTYRQIGTERQIQLETEDFLPASLDGRVACYLAVRSTWTEIEKRNARAA